MIYTPLTKKAINLMFEKQRAQRDKSGLPYVFHPFHLAEQMPDEHTTLTALLHDLVEDTDTTFEELAACGFPEEVVEALRLLTHTDGVDYFDYVRALSGNDIARHVKMADLRHNMDLNRLDTVTEKDLKRREKYMKSLEILEGVEAGRSAKPAGIPVPDYALLCEQITALAEECSEPEPLLANASALLFHALPDINWAGFYLVRGDSLILGPFQGKVACVKIARGKGVCGTAWATDTVQLVPDVHAFPGHIACDSASRSEVVLPVHAGGEVTAVLDIDSPLPARFTETDRSGLTRFAETLEQLTDPSFRL